MTECSFSKIAEICNRIFHVLFSTSKKKGGVDPLRCGQLPVLCRRNVLSKQKKTHEKRKPLTRVWQNVLTWLCGTLINPRHPTMFHASLLKLLLWRRDMISFSFSQTLSCEIIPHSTTENPLQNKEEKCVNVFQTAVTELSLSLAKYSSIEIPSLSIMQDHPHPPAIQSL